MSNMNETNTNSYNYINKKKVGWLSNLDESMTTKKKHKQTVNDLHWKLQMLLADNLTNKCSFRAYFFGARHQKNTK